MTSVQLEDFTIFNSRASKGIYECAKKSLATTGRGAKILNSSRPWMEPVVQTKLGALGKNAYPTKGPQELQVTTS